MRKSVILFFLFIVCNLYAQEDFKKISEISLKAKSGDKESITELYKASLDKTNKELHPYLVKAVSLMMLESSSKAIGKYLQNVKSLSQENSDLSFLETPPLLKECEKCTGFGVALVDCRKCQDGACRNCKGEGVITYGSGKSKKENPCIGCKSTGHCQSCKGSAKVAGKCIDCRARGTSFDKSCFAAESKRALDVLTNKALELDGDSSTVFDVEILDTDKKIQQQGREWLTARKAKSAEWLELEKKRLAAVKKRKKEKNSNLITLVETEVVETYEEGGSTPTLDQVCLEITEYLKGQERKSKQSVLNKVYGQFLSDVPTVHVVVTDEFKNSPFDYKKRAADGFFQFSLLRAQRNGYDGIAFVLLDSAGNQLGASTEKGFILKK